MTHVFFDVLTNQQLTATHQLWQAALRLVGRGIHTRRVGQQAITSPVILYQVERARDWNGWAPCDQFEAGQHQDNYRKAAMALVLKQTKWDGVVDDGPYLGANPSSQPGTPPALTLGFTRGDTTYYVAMSPIWFDATHVRDIYLAAHGLSWEMSPLTDVTGNHGVEEPEFYDDMAALPG